MSKIRLAVAITAISFICYGINRGEVSIIFKKAVRICMECIGLG